MRAACTPASATRSTRCATATGISNAHRTLHGALLDSQLLAEVWLAMTRGQDAFAIDVDDQGRERQRRVGAGQFDASVLTVLAASEAELAEHAAICRRWTRRPAGRLARDRAAARGIRAAWLSLRAVVCTQCFSC